MAIGNRLLKRIVRGNGLQIITVSAYRLTPPPARLGAMRSHPSPRPTWSSGRAVGEGKIMARKNHGAGKITAFTPLHLERGWG